MTAALLALAFLADPVYVCPGPGTLPVVLFPGCPAPVAGELLPLGHAQADRDAADALADYDRKLKTLRAELAAIPPPPSPWLWASIGALAGGLAVYLVIR